MQAAPSRFLNAAAWPLTIWSSLSRFRDHPADDYVERTFPIVATAIGFWACIAAMVYLILNGGGGIVAGDEGEVAVRILRRGDIQLSGLLWLFTPVIYVIGFWLYAAREDRFGR